MHFAQVDALGIFGDKFLQNREFQPLRFGPKKMEIELSTLNNNDWWAPALVSDDWWVILEISALVKLIDGLLPWDVMIVG